MILIRAEDRAVMGRGHRSRAEALAHACLRSKLPACILTSDSAWSRELENDALLTELLPDVSGDADEASQIAGAMKRSNATHVVVDGGRFTPAFVKMLSDLKLRVVAVDDTARADIPDAWALINPNIYASKDLYSHPWPERVFAGPDYILLRPPFLIPLAKPAVSAVVLLALGVSANDALLALLKARVEELGFESRVAKNLTANEMVAAIDSSAVVVCGASVTLHEVWARSRTAIPVYQVRDQELFWKWCIQQSIPAIISLDTAADIVADRVAKVLADIRDGNPCQQMIVDQNGGDRVVDKVFR